MVKIGILTSSRADYGVYLPLLKGMRKIEDFEATIIAFGTHLSKFHGYTIQDIEESGFSVTYTLPTLLASDDEEGISTSTALCSFKFSSFWKEHKNEFDVVLCLGDRFEMYAAVSAGVPFGIKFAHLYGGDITLGAIDNIYRDCLSHMSLIHFTSTERCARRIKELKGGNEIVEVVGILSLDDLEEIEFISLNDFYNKWGIDLNFPSLLITVHPETINPEKNLENAHIFYEACYELSKDYQLIITMPNADTEGYIFRNKFKKLNDISDNIYLIENFGRQGYFTCLKHCLLILGNSSSGISEAASFQKYVIDIGDRQKGRETGENVLKVDFNSTEIVTSVKKIALQPVFKGNNIYKRDDGVDKIIQNLKRLTEKGAEAGKKVV